MSFSFLFKNGCIDEEKTLCHVKKCVHPCRCKEELTFLGVKGKADPNLVLNFN